MSESERKSCNLVQFWRKCESYYNIHCFTNNEHTFEWTPGIIVLMLVLIGILRKKERNVTLNKSYKNVYADNYSL